MITRSLEEFAQITSDWFWEMDENLRFSYFSGPFRQVTGADPKALLGKSRSEIVAHSVKPDLWSSHLEDLAARRPFRDFIYPFKHADGGIRWFKISGKPRFDGKRFVGYFGVGTDITVEYSAQQALAKTLDDLRDANARIRLQNVRFDAAINNMSQGLAMFDRNRRLIVCNARYNEVYGLPAELAVPGTTQRAILEHRIAAGVVGQNNTDKYLNDRISIADREKPNTSLLTLNDGRILLIRHQPMDDGGWVSTHQDVTVERQAQEELSKALEDLREANALLERQNLQFGAALNNMSQGLCMYDSHKRLIVCNKLYLDMYDLDPELAKPGTPLERILDSRIAQDKILDPEEYRRARMAIAECGERVETIIPLKDGRVYSLMHHPMEGGGWVAIHQDITERKRAEAKIAHMARHDALTDLPNRLLFRDHMNDALARAARDGNDVAVLCLDLDHFKSVNDTLGHPIGDTLLKRVAGRLRSTARNGDTVARLGGDEFVVLMPRATPKHANALARRIVEFVSKPFIVEGNQINIGVSVGIAMAPSDGDDADQVLRSADMALYRAKSDGRGTAHFFEPEMDARIQKRRLLELDLRQAMEAGQFTLHYQPIVEIQTRRICEIEALLRWHHPTRGLVSPQEFIPLAEEIGLIIPLGEWLIRQACADAAKWPDEIRIAVNLSPVQFKSSNLVPTIVSALAGSGLPPRRLEVEITESVLLHHNDATLSKLHQLRNLGVHISLDDFGTGYSSLSYLRSFPFDKIKIDRSFVTDIDKKADSAAIVRSIAHLATNLGMETTAEGVETEEQFECLREEGCNQAQGYLFSRPRPAEDILPLLSNGNAILSVA